MPGVVRWQAVGGSRFNPGQAMRMGLGASGRRCFYPSARAQDVVRLASTSSDVIGGVGWDWVEVTGQLCFRERGLAHSAGNTRP